MSTIPRYCTPGTLHPERLFPLRGAIDAALSLALHHIQQGDIQRATGKACRAVAMLKQSCTEMAEQR